MACLYPPSFVSHSSGTKRYQTRLALFIKPTLQRSLLGRESNYSLPVGEPSAPIGARSVSCSEVIDALGLAPSRRLCRAPFANLAATPRSGGFAIVDLLQGRINRALLV